MRTPLPFRTVFAAWLAFGLGLAAGTLRAGEPAPTKEYQIKAVFLYNFTQFVQWPASAFASPDEPFIVAVVGASPFGRALEDAVAGETVGHRRIVVQHYTRVQDLKHCHVLFVSATERTNVDRILGTLKGRPVLTVSDFAGFVERGGAIAFYLDGPKIRFEINPAAAQREGLKLSSQLLSLAKIVAGASRPARTDFGRLP